MGAVKDGIIIIAPAAPVSLCYYGGYFVSLVTLRVGDYKLDGFTVFLSVQSFFSLRPLLF